MVKAFKLMLLFLINMQLILQAQNQGTQKKSPNDPNLHTAQTF